jgi:5'(3')-deoxyribonucleotidase
MRIGIDCDGVLRDFIPALIDSIKESHPEHSDKILEPNSWEWESWLPFWTEDETEKYVFEDNYLDFFGAVCPPINESVEDWKILKRWAEDNGHELVLVSAQRPHCEEPTTEWLKEYGFDFDEIHYTKNKWAIDVDVLIDDSPEKLNDFKEKSIVGGVPICMKQSWNKQCQNSSISIDRLSDVMSLVFG